MADDTPRDSPTTDEARGDGGTVTAGEESPRNVDYLDREVNLLRPSTPFMRDHLKVIWTGFVLWALIVFGPVTATAVAPDLMTQQLPVIGFPLHYFLVAIGAPGGALLLAIWYARRRDKLDRKYGIQHDPVEADGGSSPAADGTATVQRGDGGERE